MAQPPAAQQVKSLQLVQRVMRPSPADSACHERGTPMESNPVGWFEIYVQDIERAKKFYESVFAMELTKMDSPMSDWELYGFPSDMQSSGASGAIVKMDGVPSGGNSTLVYFSCDDCATEASRVESAGGKIFKPKFSIEPYGFIALAVDIEGNMFGLHSMK